MSTEGDRRMAKSAADGLRLMADRYDEIASSDVGERWPGFREVWRDAATALRADGDRLEAGDYAIGHAAAQKKAEDALRIVHRAEVEYR